MFKKIKISTVGNILAGMVLVLAFSFYYITNNIRSELTLVNITWENYQASRSEKARLESSLRSAIGYGGMIHSFKNFILREDISNFDVILSDIGAARSVINQYRAMGVNGAETIALIDIENVLNAYNNATLRVSQLVEAGISSPEEIDNMVRIDDTTAFRGLGILAQQVFSGTSLSDLKTLTNGRLVALLRSQFGYGGVIHYFKNYILRHEDTLIPLFTTSKNSAANIIAEYQSREITETEKVALLDIAKTLSDYEVAFKKAQTLNLTAEEIDQQLMVDDSFAIRSFTLLDREVVALSERNANIVQEELLKIQKLIELSIYWGFIVAFIFVSIAILTIRYMILNPIRNMTSEMLELAQGNDKITVRGLDLKNEIGDMAGAVVTFQENLKKLKAAERSVRRMSLTDPLTGLANRTFFETRFNETINLAKRLKTSGALLAIDLDGFKRINDEHGHGAGDYVLKIIAERLSNVSREVDVVARLGGDEFSIIAIGLDEKNQIIPLAERIIQEADRPIIFENVKLKVSASVGISFFLEQGKDIKDIANKADIALYRAKEEGKNQYVFFEEEIEDKEDENKIATPTVLTSIKQ